MSKLQEISQRSQILSRVQTVHSFYCFSKICSNLIAKEKLRKIVYLVQEHGSKGQISISNLSNVTFSIKFKLTKIIIQIPFFVVLVHNICTCVCKPISPQFLFLLHVKRGKLPNEVSLDLRQYYCSSKRGPIQ